MKRFTAVLFGSIACATAFQTAACAQSLTIDNFESYTNNQTLATSSVSTPYIRFGSVEDNLYAKNGASLDPTGLLGAQIPIDPTGANGFAVAAKNLGTATNFSTYTQATFLSKSLAATSTTGLKLYLSDGGTTYVSTVSQAETTSTQTYTYPLTASAFTRTSSGTGGTDTFATVLGATTLIGVEIVNFSGTGSSAETDAFDDIALQTVISPEPASAGMLLCGLAVLAFKRGRRHAIA